MWCAAPRQPRTRPTRATRRHRAARRNCPSHPAPATEPGPRHVRAGPSPSRAGRRVATRHLPASRLGHPLVATRRARHCRQPLAHRAIPGRPCSPPGRACAPARRCERCDLKRFPNPRSGTKWPNRPSPHRLRVDRAASERRCRCSRTSRGVRSHRSQRGRTDRDRGHRSRARTTDAARRRWCP